MRDALKETRLPSPYREPAERDEEPAPAEPDSLDQRIVPMLTVAFLVPIEVAAGRADRWGLAAAFVAVVVPVALFVQRQMGSAQVKPARTSNTGSPSKRARRVP